MEIVKFSAKKAKKLAFPRPLSKLSAYSNRIRKRVLEEFALSDSETVLLDLSLSWLDEARRYQEMVDAMGVESMNERSGASRPNPALAALQHCRTSFLQAWRLLGLKDTSEKQKPGRPPAIYGD